MAQSVTIKKVSPWMEALADLLILQPTLTNTEVAGLMKRTPAWISSVKHSDMFQDYWMERRREHGDALTLGIKEKSAAAVEMALDHLNTQIERNGSIMPVGVLLEVIDINSKRLYGGADKNSSGPQINQAFIQGLVTGDQLSEARERMRTARETPSEVVALKEVKEG